MIKYETLISNPFFIFYDARSGSTFLANQLVTNYELAITPETNFVTCIVTEYKKSVIADIHDLNCILEIIFSDIKFHDLGFAPALLRQEIEDLLPLSTASFIRVILTIYRNTHFSHAKLCGIKKGSYAHYHEHLYALFPKARFIGLIRDGRAVFNSKKHSIYSYTSKPFETDPVNAARTWQQYVRLLRHIEQLYEHSMIVHYETLIRDRHRVLENIAAFLGVSGARSESGRWAKYVVAERYGTDLHKNIYKEPLPDRLTRWRTTLTTDEILAFESIASQELQREGYPLFT